ncbi:MAG TPA: hypothetical protein VHO70_12880 [Chitinispirillaceae bacterium]|nr:hypothetical protein [Chitinispirillaceae bacterium]
MKYRNRPPLHWRCICGERHAGFPEENIITDDSDNARIGWNPVPAKRYSFRDYL